MSIEALRTLRVRDRTLADALVRGARGGDDASLTKLSEQTGVGKEQLRALVLEDATAKLFGLPLAARTMFAGAVAPADAGGVGKGGTLALKGGFRGVALDLSAGKNVALLMPLAHGGAAVAKPAELVAQVDMMKVAFAREGRPSSHTVALDAAATQALAKRQFATVAAKMGGTSPDDPAIVEKTMPVIQQRLATARATKTPDFELGSLLSMMSSKATLGAFLDPKTGAVALAEIEPPLSANVAREIDPEKGLAALQRMNHATAGIDEATLRAAASAIPTSALLAIEKSGVELRAASFDGLYETHEREADLIGKKAAEGLNHKNDHAGGVFRGMFTTVTITPGDDAIQRGTFIRHELAHALDSALAPPGAAWVSDGPEFKKIFDDTLASMKSGGVLQPPTDYSATNPQEMFAEAAAMYLGVHTSNSDAPNAHGRGHLQGANPALYAYMEKLFGEVTPAALDKGAINGTAQRQHHMVEELAQLEKKPMKSRTDSENYTFAALQTIVGASTKNAAKLTQALEAITHVKGRASKLFGLIKNADTEARANELIDRIKSHLAAIGK